MRLVFPNISYKEKAIDYINEFIEYGSEINGSGSLDRYLEEETYELWLEKISKSPGCPLLHTSMSEKKMTR